MLAYIVQVAFGSVSGRPYFQVECRNHCTGQLFQPPLRQRCNAGLAKGCFLTRSQVDKGVGREFHVHLATHPQGTEGMFKAAHLVLRYRMPHQPMEFLQVPELFLPLLRCCQNRHLGNPRRCR